MLAEPTAASPAAIVEERGLAHAGRATSCRRDRRPRARGQPEGRREFKDGKDKAIGAIVGFVMRETKGRADGGEVKRLIREKIGS